MVISIQAESATSYDALALQQALSLELSAITGSSGAQRFSATSLAGSDGFFLIARTAEHKAVGCVACRPLDIQARIAEVKRMYVVPEYRGVGTSLVVSLVDHARLQGFTALWLETRKVNERAVQFWLRQGFQVRENYGPYQGREDAVCFARPL
ncbi:hypothetical protein DT73_19325 [Mangrovibacter sp. MFB070]|nr:hypothetical protein DT73_19325 [Mangrovibacter sp. MFB070]